MPFAPGQGGRKAGARNKVQHENKEFCRKLISAKDYRTKLKERLMSGTLPPVLESMLWYYGIGKPVESYEHSGPDGGPIPTTVIHEHHAD